MHIHFFNLNYNILFPSALTFVIFLYALFHTPISLPTTDLQQSAVNLQLNLASALALASYISLCANLCPVFQYLFKFDKLPCQSIIHPYKIESLRQIPDVNACITRNHFLHHQFSIRSKDLNGCYTDDSFYV